LNKADLRGQATILGTFENRLRQQVASKGGLLDSCLNDGLRTVCSDVQRTCEDVDRALRMEKQDSLIGFDEFDHDILHRRDRIQYALDMSEQVGLDVTGVRRAVKILDDRIRSIVPRVLKVYRESGDFTPIDPTVFPETFWWRTRE